MKTSYLLPLPLFFFTSCATITRGVHEKLTVLSEPSGANVVLSSGETGVTPTKFVKTRRDNFTVTVRKPGFLAQSVRVESKASATGETAMAGNILIPGALIGVGVDATSGAYNSLYPNPVFVHLVPVGKSAPAGDMEEHRGRPSSITKGSSPAPEPSPTPE
jgi:hypothetical protein